MPNEQDSELVVLDETTSGEEQLGTLSRRQVALSLLGLAGLAGCASEALPEDAIDLGLTAEALTGTGTNYFWVTAIGTSAAPLDLRNLSGMPADQVVIATGFLTHGDGGGGAFLWDAASTAADDGGAVIQPASLPATGRWRRIDSGSVNVRWFGARGNGTTDDTIAIQAAINCAGRQGNDGNGGGTVYFPPGDYILGDTLKISQALGHRAVCLRGATSGPQHGGYTGTRLRWTANAPTKAIIQLWGSESSISDMSIVCDAASTAKVDRAIDCTKAPGNYAYGANRFANLYIASLNHANPGMKYGIVIGDMTQGDATLPQNGENLMFSDVFFQDLSGAGVFVVNESGQAKNHVYLQCHFNGTVYGIHTRSSSFKCYSCSFNTLTAAIFEKTPCDVIGVYDTDSEWCQRFYAHEGGGSSAQRPMYFVGGRYALNALAADGVYFDFYQPGPVTMVGVLFKNASSTNFTIRNIQAPTNHWQIATMELARFRGQRTLLRSVSV